MVDRKHRHVLKRVTSAVLLLSLLSGVASCSAIRDILNSNVPVTTSVTSVDPNGRDPNATFGTMEPTGSYTSESSEEKALDADYIKSILVHSVWYDVVSGNPADYTSVSSKKAFALKGVFYFSAPLSAVFEARLYKGDEVLMKKDVKVDNDVTCGCDFSAGLEGLGTFEAGSYTVVLLFDGKEVAKTDAMRVE